MPLVALSSLGAMEIPASLMRSKAKPKRKFSPEQDQRIRELVGDERFPDWAAIAEEIEGKNARQCRERYQHYLAPQVCGQPWTSEEDERLRELHATFGNDWARIAAQMPGRTNTGVKNRFNGQLYQQRVTPADEGPIELGIGVEMEPITDFEIPDFGAGLDWDDPFMMA
jgi:hypothetical protein